MKKEMVIAMLKGNRTDSDNFEVLIYFPFLDKYLGVELLGYM